MLHPHLGEFDEDILFRRRLDYEREVFEWLERNTAGRYDVVIEVGANVGVYTCFFQEIIRANPGGRLGKVFSFEPSREAFRRLQLNVMANRASDVELFNVAVGDRFGFIDFYEPTGHLTNGSIDKSFSALFSDEVKRATAVCVRPNSLERFAPSGTSSLLKIDVEGYEPQLLADMFDFVNASKPDILIEVLDVSVNLISQTKFLSQYDFYLISSSGLQRHDALFPDQTARDWLLVHKSRPL